MKRTIVLEPVNKDRFLAERLQQFGDVEYLFSRGESRQSIWSAEFEDDCVDALQRINYQPGTDMLVIVGATVPLIKLVARLAASYGMLQVLLWNASANQYVLQEIGHATGVKGGV